MPKTLFAVVAVAVLLFADPAAAQSSKGAHGGLVVKSHGHPIELVVQGQDILFYLGDDDGSPLPTKGMKGRATIQDGDKTATVDLRPDVPNKLVGRLAGPLGAKAKVAFSTSLHGHGLTARYVTE
jgi:hypothetical protein